MKLYRQNIAVVIFSITLLTIVVGVFLTSTDWNEGRALQWISALSGWVAGIFAAITAGVLISQMKTMRKQLANQEAQTNFVTGNLPPEFYPYTPENEFALEFRLENNSIRSVREGAIEVLRPSQIQPQLFDHGREIDYADTYNDATMFICDLPGWYNRNAASPYTIISLCFVDQAGETFRGSVELRIRLKMSGDDDFSFERVIEVDLDKWLP
ncbi:hypothetical protein [uncultured Roseibium sp.]|uniref:hypothetical protein n=1 Tax=uncultured Roseibium sp. TaxID=1936171 RepID=UPI00261878A0|nr:hypothetical protein [uncultured Roseibium sp.]